MSEYLHVEKPFLDQLAELNLTVIDQCQSMISSDSKKSLRVKIWNMGSYGVIWGQVTFFMIWFLSPLRVFSAHAFLPFSRGLFLPPSLLAGIEFKKAFLTEPQSTKDLVEDSIPKLRCPN